MPTPRRSTQLRGSKAAPGPSEKSRLRAANIGAYQAGRNYAARKSNAPTATPRATPSPSPTPKPIPNAVDMVAKGIDILRRR